MKANCASCGRECTSAAISPKHLCLVCEYMSPQARNKVMARAAEKHVEPLPAPARKNQRRRNSFRKGATA